MRHRPAARRSGLFIYGWNEYLWPLLITNTEDMWTVVVGLESLIPRSGTELPTWNLIMAGAMMALLPPVAVIVFMQRWFVRGLIESEKSHEPMGGRDDPGGARAGDAFRARRRA